jgi:uncharacterized membrane protein
MMVNHFPIIGTIFGFGILVASQILKNKSIQNTAYILFIITAIFAFASMSTGEGAEEMVEDFPNIGHQIIHEHEEVAEKMALVLYMLGIVSIGGIYLNRKNHPKSKLLAFLIVVIAIVSISIGTQVGTTGGEIRHTEIKKNTTPNTEKIPNKETEKSDES